jgi:predicted dehydrogenase
MIGAGARGQEWLRQVLALPNTQLVAITDAYSRRREEAAALAPKIETLDEISSSPGNHVQQRPVWVGRATARQRRHH